MPDTDPIHATVIFPLSKEPPFKQAFPPQATVDHVLSEALEHFHVKAEPGVVYYLSAHDRRQEPTTTLAQIAGESDSIAFRMSKEEIQG